jgi:hypothetical protein
MLRSLVQRAVRRTGTAAAVSPCQAAFAPRFSVTRQQQQPLQLLQQQHSGRSNCGVGQICFHSTSSTNNNDGDTSTDNLKPPEKLTPEMAEGIAETTKFYVRHGMPRQRLLALAADTETPVVQKWQRMMEIFLTTQVHVISGMGYSPDEQGLGQYAQALSRCIQDSDDTMQELFQELRRDTWRELVATAFDLKVQDIPVLTIVDARNIMHKVSSKMMEPNVLLEIQTKTAKIGSNHDDDNEDYDVVLAEKHQVLQDIIVNHVYMSGSPTLIEEFGFGPGPKGYATMQCAMSDFEGDPLIGQYAGAAMVKVWEAAGLDISALQQGHGG